MKKISLLSIPVHWQATIWKILSCACFALINGLVRYLTGGSSLELSEPLSVTSIVFFQNLFGTLFLIPWILKDYKNPLNTKYMKLHIFRVTLAVLGVVLWYLSLQFMEITQAVALGFTGPIFTVIGSYFFLKERLGPMRFLALAASFFGAVLVLRPDKTLISQSSFIGIAAIIPLISAIVISSVKMCSRKLAVYGESPKAMTTFLMLFMTPVSLLIALIYDFTIPSLHHLPYLILMGFLATAAHLSISKAYITGEVTFIMPFGISKIILSSAIGYFAFGEYPKMWTVWLGATIIFLSVLLLSYQNYLDKRNEKWKKSYA